MRRLAARDGMSVNAVAVRELTDASRYVDNAALLATLPDLDITREEILDDLDRGRAER